MLAIVGPTASGKTSLAIAVAQRIQGEIISLDSRQAYHGFVVGTAAPAEAELEAAPHHGVGFLDPHERYGAGRFVRAFDGWRAEIEARGRVPILAGGTGLFLRALTHPMFREPDHPPGARDAIEAWLADASDERVRTWASRLDPDLAGGETAIDRQRAGRTIELALLTGRGLSWWIEHGPVERPPIEPLTFVLDPGTERLRERIRARTEAMLAEDAWQDEVRALTEAGHSDTPAFEALGYGAVAALIRGERTRAETVDRIFASTWRYARRQRTWFRHQLPASHVVLDASESTEQLAARIIETWSREERPSSPQPSADAAKR